MKYIKNSLLSVAIATALIPSVSSASVSWELNYTDANVAGGLGIVLNSPVSAVTDEYKVTLESALGFSDNDLSGGISAGDTFVDYIFFNIDNLFAGGSNTFDNDYQTANTQLSGTISAAGLQVDALNYLITSADIEFYFDGPTSGGTVTTFTDLSTFTDGVLVQTGSGSGAGVNGALIPNGASDINFELTDILSTLGAFSEFELFLNPNLSLTNIVFQTGSDNAVCQDSLPIGVPCFADETDLFAAFGDAPGNHDFTFHVRSDGSAIKATPEPSTVILLGMGLLGLGQLSRRRV
ncbi:MAG: PEP-CTERM sorting domain-containing protein [Methyloprofundus sp.]|nr:PEP-CTERM sorting domain-containing protein [Methyloprofundus sp.]